MSSSRDHTSSRGSLLPSSRDHISSRGGIMPSSRDHIPSSRDLITSSSSSRQDHQSRSRDEQYRPEERYREVPRVREEETRDRPGQPSTPIGEKKKLTYKEYKAFKESQGSGQSGMDDRYRDHSPPRRH